MKQMEQEDDVFDLIEQIVLKAEQNVEEEKYKAALKKFKKAFDLLPLPKDQYTIGTYLLSAIGDLFFIIQKFDWAISNLTTALEFPEGKNNGFIHLRLGQAYYKKEEMEKAGIHLSKALELEGEEIFEDEASIYLDYIMKNS